MSPWKDVHWLAPTSLITYFLAGIAFAFGHHIFYRSLAGTPASITSYNVMGLSVSGQQASIATGTALALLSKTSFLLAASTTYVQALWWSASSHRRPMKVASVDAAFTVLEDLTAFFRVSTWQTHPILLFLAVTAWLLPIASIITPAMLSMQIAPVHPPPVSLRHVPNLDFAHLGYPIVTPSESFTPNPHDSETAFSYQGPSHEVQRIAAAVISDGNILRIPSPGVNASWSVSFSGPSLSCGGVDPEEQKLLVCRFMEAGSAYIPRIYRFASWSSNLDPFVSITELGPCASRSGHLGFLRPIEPIPIVHGCPSCWRRHERLKPNPAVFKACGQSHVNISTLSPINTSALSFGAQEVIVQKRATFIKCEVFNSTYDSHFNVTNGQQHIRSQVTPLHRIDTFPHNLWFGNIPINHHTEIFLDPADSPKDDHWEERALSLLRHDARQISYRSVVDSFRALLAGSVYENTHGYTVHDSSITGSTFLQTPELQHLLERAGVNRLQEAVTRTNATMAHKLLPPAMGDTRPSLAGALEESFQNLTISLMSSELLRPVASSPFAPPPTNVMFHYEHAVYVYSAPKLWLAYGLEATFTFIAVLIGIAMFHANGASFSNRFSSILLRSKSATLSTEPRHCDLRGRDPLPKYISHATIRFLNAGDGGKIESLNDSSASSVQQGADMDQRVESAYTSQTLPEKVSVTSPHGSLLEQATSGQDAVSTGGPSSPRPWTI